MPRLDLFWFSLIALLPFTVCFFWAVTFLLDGISRGWQAGRPLLCLFSAACAVLYMGHGWHFLQEGEAFSILDALYASAHLAVFPIFLLYLYSIASPRGVRPMQLLLLLPSAVALVLGLVVCFTGSNPSPVNFCSRFLFPPLLIYTLVAGNILLSRYNREVRNFYADSEQKTMEPLSVLLWLLVVISIISLVANYIGRDAFAARFPLAVPSLLFSALLFSVMWVGARLRFTAQDLSRDLGTAAQDVPAAQENPAAPQQPSGLMSRIDELVKERKIYRQHGLTVSDVAAAAGTNRTYVSNAINQQLGISFSEYINRLRIEESKRIISEADGKVVLSAVAEEAGFVSEATFYRYFRRLEGKTPTEWWREQAGRS